MSQKNIFVTCPKCGESISGEEGTKKLRDWVADPANTTDVIAKCLELEERFGSEIPMAILLMVEDAFPLNEKIAFLNLKFNNYQKAHVKNHLTRFAKIKAKGYLPWAEEFLNSAMTVRNMEYSDLFEDYINNKVISKRKDKLIEMMRGMRASYTKTSTSNPALGFLYTFYVSGAVLNLGLVILYLFLNMPIFIFVLITATILAVELFILFLHNRIFGNRMEISDNERLLMVIYMSSIAVAIGGTFIGAFVNL